MSKLDDILGRKPVVKAEPPRPQGMEVGGSFQCNTCYQEADIAEYFPNEQLLLWYCPLGHENYLEKFNLG